MPEPAGGFRLAGLITLGIWTILWAPQVFGGRVFVSGDWPKDLPFAEFSATRWRETHQRTFWNPYVFAGIPAVASLADPRPQYLPDVLLDVVGAIDRLPVWPPIVMPLLFHLAGMLATAGLVRAWWRVGPWPMAWAAGCWGLMPFQLVPFAHGHHAQLVSVGLMPVSLLATHALFAMHERRKVALATLMLAAVVAMQLLAGHPQFTYLSLVFSGASALERASRFGRWRRLVPAGGAIGLALAISAAVWWPMLLYGAESVRGREGGVVLEEVRLYSLALRDFLVFAWPAAMGFADPTYWGGLNGTDFPQYFGLLVLLMAARGAWGRDRAARLLVILASVAVVLSLGARLGPVYGFLRDVVPFWSRLRVAVAPLIVAQLAVVLLSSRGLDRVLATPLRIRKSLVLATAALAIAAGLTVSRRPFEGTYASIAVRARPGFDRGAADAAAATARASIIVQLALLAAGLALIAARRTRLGFAVAPALTALGAFDLGLVSMPLMRASTGERAQLEPAPSALARLASVEPGTRVSSLSMDELTRSNDWIRWRVSFAGGAHGSPPGRWADVAGSGLIQLPTMLRALAVSHLSGARGTPIAGDFERLPKHERGLPILRLHGTLPRAYAVSEVRAPGNDVAVLRAMAREDSFPSQVAFASEVKSAGHYAGSAGCAIRWIEDKPDRIELSVSAPDRAFVVVADAWFSGWSARIDGAVAPIVRVNHMLRGIAIPAGRHQVVMGYTPPGWRMAVPVTRIAMTCWLLAVATLLVRCLPRATRDKAPMSDPART